jgi:acetyl-CoA decarbonylase/synthase complex subunit gamma
MKYIVPPGLFAVGDPGEDDPVVVTANYKMSYDMVREALAGHKAWLLVLETFGINVWCAAGKGTFGTEELVRRVASVGLEKVVTHRNLLLPILGAPGVAAHEVAKRTGFNVRYVSTHAADLPEYLKNGMETTPRMRELTFTFRERLALVPVEFVLALKPLLAVSALLFLIGILTDGSAAGLKLAVAWIGAVVTGTVVAPLMLPWLPGRSFAVKGGIAGLAWAMVWYLLADRAGWASGIAAGLALPAVSAFFTLNFTGSTPFTSRSGVKREMRVAIPAIGLAILAAGVAFAVGFYS